MSLFVRGIVVRVVLAVVVFELFPDVVLSEGLPLTDPERERKKLVAVTQQAGEDFQGYTAALYSQLFDLSKAYQAQLNRGKAPLCTMIEEAIAKTPEVFPELLTACFMLKDLLWINFLKEK